MADNTLIEKTNAELKDLHDDLIRRRDHPGLIKLTNLMMRLTNSPEANAALDAQPTAPDVKEQEKDDIRKQIAALSSRLNNL